MSSQNKDGTTLTSDEGSSARNTTPNADPKGGKGKNLKKKSSSGPPKQSMTESKTAKPAPVNSGPLFPEGNKVLESYGLSISGRKERVLSTVKTEHYFRFVELSWSRLVDAKPDITKRFSLAEWRHAHALMLYGRIEQVTFDAVGTKPAAPTRIPLPRNLRVFQPIWSVLASIGTVEDDELGVIYIPQAVLPKSQDLQSIEDIEGLLSCCLYDWSASWEEVETKRSLRDNAEPRVGIDVHDSDDESAELSTDARHALILKIQNLRKEHGLLSKKVKLVKGSSTSQAEVDRDNQRILALERELSETFEAARADKKERIRPKFNVSSTLSCYSVTDDEIVASPGAYGAWLHWDPKLWIEYEQIVEQLSLVAMFSLSMPNETVGTYSWLLPVESKNSDVFAKLPKKSIATPVWILALLIQTSTLPLSRRSTWYIETDSLANVGGLALRYISAAIKRGAPTEQYGTY